MTSRSNNRGGVYSNIDGMRYRMTTKQRRQLDTNMEVKDRIEEDGAKRPSSGAGATPVTEWGSTTLVNYDQLAEIEKRYTVQRVLSPIIKTATLNGRKVVAAKLYTDAEWAGIWKYESHCAFCDIQYDNAPRPGWAVAFTEDRCHVCRAPRGRDAIVASPIYFGPLSSIANQINDEEQVTQHGQQGNADVQARLAVRQSLHGHRQG